MKISTAFSLLDNPLLKKLQIKDEYSVLLMNSNPSIHPLFEGARIEFSPSKKEEFDSVILFTRNEKELTNLVSNADEKRRENGIFWVSYPKKSGSIETDLNRDSSWAAINSFGFEPVRLVSINEDWSSMRLVHREERAKPSKLGQDPPGVDRVSKTVIPPQDLKKEFDQHPKALTFFESLAFSHKREYVGWIEDAKKEETRVRRINKTIELLLEGEKTK